MATRIESKQRPHKRFIGAASYNTTTGAVTSTSGRIPRPDLRGYPSRNGISEWYSATDITV